MRTLLAVATIGLVVPTVLPTAATQTTSPPPAVHAVTGRLLDVGGSPLAGSSVVLSENRGLTNDIFGSFAAVFSLGLSCAAGADPCRSSGSSTVQTDAQGNFSFSTSQVATALGHSNGLILEAGDPAKGAVTVRLNPTLGGDLGTLQLWNPQVQTTNDHGLLTETFTAPNQANSQTEIMGNVAWAGQGQWTTLGTKGVHGQVTLDPRAWEDKPAQLTLTSGFHRSRAGQQPRVDWLSSPVVLPSAGVPLSRHKPCQVTGQSIQGCPLTDGNLFASRVQASSATIDMGSPVNAGVVAIRPAGSYSAAVSTDGTTWHTLSTTETGGIWNAALFEAQGPAWRYLRVTAASTSPLNQVSVWPGSPSASFVTPSTAPGTTTPNPTSATGPISAAPTTPSHHKHLAWGWVVVAALLILGAGLGTGVLIGRRTSAS